MKQEDTMIDEEMNIKKKVDFSSVKISNVNFSKKVKDEEKKSKISPTRKIAMKSTQNDIPIRDIYRGMIIIKGKPFNRYVKIIEVSPISYSLKTNSEQNRIFDTFKGVFSAGPTRMQFITLSLKANLKKQIAILDKEISEEQNEQCAEVGKKYREKLVESQEDGIEHRFFVVFEYDGKNTSDINKIYRNMLMTENTICQALESCGNRIVSFGDNTQEINTSVAEILYTFYNRNEILSEPFEKRMERVFTKYSSYYNSDDFSLSFTELVAPRNVSYLNSKYIVVNSDRKKDEPGTYYSFLYIPTNGYLGNVTAGWLNNLLPLAQGIDTTVYFEKVPREQLMGKLRRNLTYTEANGNAAANNSATADNAVEAYGSGYYLKEGLSMGQEFFYMATLITVSGKSPEEVDQKVEYIKNTFKTWGLRVKECRYQEEMCFDSALPFCDLATSIWNKAKQNVLTEGAATTYPFDDSLMNDPNGIYFGDDASTGSLVVVDLFDTKKYSSSNVFICGQTGKGKTYALLLMAIRMRIKHIPVFILAPEKEHEFKRVCDALGGQFIQMGAGSQSRINIMEIFKQDDEASKAIDGTTSADRISYPAVKAESLKNFFKLLVTAPVMTTEEETLLDKAIVETYRRKGITFDNESLYDPSDFMKQKFKEMPIISDLVEVLKEDERSERLATIIGTLSDGSANSFNGQTNVNLNNNFTVIGLEHLTGKMLPLGIYMAMDYCWSKIKEDRTKKKVLFIDEWWRLASNPIAAEYSLEIAKVIRAYGGSMVIATQQMNDILSVNNGQFGKAVLNNCKTKILLGMEKDDVDDVQRLIGINNTEAKRLKTAPRGEALFIAGGNNVRIQFIASDIEHQLITTDREELAQQAKKAKQNEVTFSFDDLETATEANDSGIELSDLFEANEKEI